MLSTIPALFLFDRLGRRNLLLFCGLGMVVGHLVAATVLEVSLFDSLIRTNTRTRMIQTKKERVMKECVCVEACEGMLEDMPVTYFPTSEKR